MDQTNSVTAEMGERRSVSGHMFKLVESTGLPDRLDLTRILSMFWPDRLGYRAAINR